VLDIEEIKHTADIGIKVKGRSLRELFKNAALGVISLAIAKPGSKKKAEKYLIYLKSASLDELLHDFLNEIIYLIFSKKKCVIDTAGIKLDEDAISIKAEIRQLAGVSASGCVIRELKSVTFHGLKIIKNKKGYSADIIIDT